MADPNDTPWTAVHQYWWDGTRYQLTATATPLPVNIVSGGGSGGTSSSFGAAFPVLGTAAGFIDNSGNMAGGTLDAAGYLKVNVAAGSSGNAAASATGSAVPAAADYGGLNVGGTLRGHTGSNPSGAIYAADMVVRGTLPAFAAIPRVAIDQTTPGDTNAVDVTNFAVTQDQNAGAAGASTLRVVLATGGATPLPSGAATAALQSVVQGVIGAATAPTTMNAVGGVYNSTPITLSNGQSCAIQLDANGYQKVNLTNASVAVTGTFWQATQPVSIADGGSVTLGAKADAKSTATDTTPITAMSVWKQISASVQLMVFGAGTAAAAQRTTLASDDPAVATLGATTGAKVVTDANGTIQQYLRGLVTFFANALGAGTAAAAHRVTLASDDPAVATLGATTGAAVITDANGTIQQYLRGLIKQWATTFVAQGSTSSGELILPIGARTLAASPTDTTAQTNAPVMDIKGSTIVQPYGLGDNVISGLTAAMTGTTSTAVTGIGAPGAGLYNYITTIVVGNSHATVGTFLELQDGSGGTTFFTIPAAAVYGGAVITLPKPLKQPTANTALYCKNTTTGANVIVSVAGFKGP